ncbi:MULTISPECIES: phospho-N-acetylmuramoyl-pentapeptide-transferase [unclassified Enterococcus]|uniref:phospho-N-acetylmuramoyl-pentapeptide- transferase n=1 Tax=unclassified Enterococcus TaxID=2608891 RepID=UPI0015528956|nr:MULTISPECIES: phospho-N-acetylmuramoyl-pentapeptide-transferase [unclassified Enterococcus]MBS7576225.1 phospho-N-acetylmuramoyl-pentapeptide-transferase [Enterococcus sp. MMGLQ5-2]MBS7583458.1 phospho-N-acetylmuramoyl-pentapeptide-transferase [Enterococcus sp. MMGLQ5-1]NPD11318.1 phospho-N-acetylmuramoyl-pentapeptide-transferase [Enterococcus sp. MMGLQ5-1]NPD36061.1 phospho-N-acetylmuramoyl-pentapeptide-transferase [Enterococcus sp. MMGLQ5-2]
MFLALIISFAITVSTMPLFIGYFHLKKIDGQQMHEDVKQHIAKAGTPTMGGVVFLFAIILTSIACGILMNLFSVDTFILLFIIFLYGILGFLDDFLKIFKHKNEGLKANQKLIGQIIGAVIFFLVYQGEAFSNRLNIFGHHINLGWFYALFLIFWLVGFSNAVNLTDGIDGLATISVTISLIAYAVIAYKQKQFDVLLVILTSIGGLIGFFGFNRKPAKIFMGDVGSLALGGLLATISILLHQEWTLLLIGFVYVIETSSVMLQVASFKLRGKRIFAMSPIHHHFELGGFTGHGKKWSEWRVDFLFWTVGLIMSLITLAILY